MEKTRILIVDDERNIRNALRRILLGQNYDMQFASNGNDGLRLCETFEFAIILLDIMMPGINGVDVCTQIKKKYPLTKVILLSAKNSKSDWLNGYRAFADDYISKPYDPDVLLAKIRALVSAYQTTHQMRIQNSCEQGNRNRGKSS